MKKNLNLLKFSSAIIAFLLLSLFSTKAQNGPAVNVYTNAVATISTGLGSNTVFDVYVSGNTMYAATSVGLSISTDGGTTFINKTTTDGLGNNGVNWIYLSGSTLYAATNGGLSISTDGGSIFTNKTTTNGLGSNVVYGVFASGSTLYAATGGGLSISTDGGTTFTNKTTANGLGSNSVNGVYASGSTIYAATGGGLSISTDGGSTFTNKTTANGLENNTVIVVYVSGNTVYAATGGGLSISTDGGAAFTNKTTTNGLGSNTVYGVYVSGSTVYAATSGGLSISTDGGTTFINKNTTNGLGSNTVFMVYASGSNVYAATSGGLSTSTNGGTTFVNTAKTKPSGNGLGNNSVLGVYASGSTVYAATSGGLSISKDGGATYTNKTTTNGLASNTVNGVYATGIYLYAATAGGLSISIDDGASYTNKKTLNGLGSNTVYGVYASGNGNSSVYVATNGGLTISTNGAVSFTNKTTANGLGSNSVRGVYAIGSTVYAATIGGLSISTDGGSNFTNKTTANGLVNNTVNGVYAIGSTVYAATIGGLSISIDGGASYTNKTITSGLGSNTIWGVFASGNTVYAATSGGLSISTNGGVTFANYTTANGLGSNTSNGVYASATTVYAATSGGVSFCSQACTPPSSGGTISQSQSGTNPFNPDAFTSTIDASGQSGTLEYKWQSSTASNSSGFSDIASSNAATYDAGALTQTTWFKRLARVTCSADWSGAAESNVIEVTLITCTPSTSTETLSACGSYIWHGTTYTESNNTAIWTGVNAGGCDSVVTLNLTINATPSTPSVNVVNNCNGTSTLSTTAAGALLWSTTETASPITVSNDGTYAVSQTVNGCTSASGSGVAAPKTTNTGDTTASVCGSFVWYGVSYNASTTATHTFTNVNGCDSVVTLHLTINALPLSPTATLVQPTCNMGGTITVSNVLSGSSYSIDGFNYSSTGAFSDLAPGTYSITAKNAAGCISGPTTVTLNEPTGVPPSATLSVTHPSCASAYGTIRVTSTVFFNSFSIDRANFSNLTGVFSGLPAGTYNVWVKNAAGCISAPSTVVVNAQPATPLAPKVSITQPTCTVSTGTIEISSNLGDNLYYSTNNFTYLNITGVFTGMVSGSYNVTSKNAAGCISPATPVVINPRLTIPATPTAVVTQPSCLVSTATITVSSPSAAYTYSITRSGQTMGSPNGFFSGVASGTYSLIAISNAGCGSSSKRVVVNAQPATPTAPALSVTQPTASVATGTIRVTSTVFGNSFSINVSGFTNLTGVFSGLPVNAYSITAKSSAGCISQPSTVSIGSGLARGTETPAPVVLSVLPIVPSAMASDLFEVGAYPNPSNTDFKLSINSASSETIRVTVYDVFGRAVKYFSFASKPFITLGQDLKAGVYMVELRQGKNIKSLKLVKF